MEYPKSHLLASMCSVRVCLFSFETNTALLSCQVGNAEHEMEEWGCAAVSFLP